MTVLRRIGSSAYIHSASIAGGLPMPMIGMNSAKSASAGSVRKIEAVERTSARARGRVWIHTPSRTEVTVANAMTISTIRRCWSVASVM